ncbi:MAG: 2-oxoacid:acceptor oxidoreductase family protein [Planctomycetota bacterium]
MAETEVLMAGFGGQGMLLAGKILAHAAMTEGLEVSWLPSYGPEMRGGTANVTVCISKRPIGSPLITNPRGLLVMNLPSLEKFAPKVRPGGVIVINASLVNRGSERDDVVEIKVAAREMAAEAGTHRAANFVMLGAYVGATGVVPEETIESEIAEEFSGSKEKFVPANVAALRAGLEAVRKVAGQVRSSA